MANIDFPSSPTVGQRYTFAGVTYTYTAQGVWSPGSSIAISTAPQGRLTLQNGAPVMVSNTTGVTSLFYTPYLGDRIPIWNGQNMVMTKFVELVGSTIDITKNPSAIGVNEVDDWFVWNDAGTIRLTHGLGWTNDTTRGASTALTRLDGILTNTNAITNGPAANKGTFVGTTRSDVNNKLTWQSGSSILGGGQALMFVWNAYNRVDVFTEVSDSTLTWTPAALNPPYDPVPLNSSLGNRVTFVTGLREDAIQAAIWQPMYTNSGNIMVGIGFDSINTMGGPSGWVAGATTASGVHGVVNVYPAVMGVHFMQAMQWAAGAGGWVFYGDGYVYTNGIIQQGMQVTLKM